LGIFNQFLHTYYTFLSALDYKFLFNYLLFLTLTKLCHHDHLANFLHFTTTLTSKFNTEQMTSLLASSHIRHVCWHYKSVYFIVTCHTTINKAINDVWTHAFRPMVDILSRSRLMWH